MNVPLTDDQRRALRAEQTELGRSHLRKKLYAFLWTKSPGVTDDDMLALLPAHVRFLHQLAEDGVLFGSGPLFDGDDAPYGGGGLTIVRAASYDDAKAVMKHEPLVEAGLRSFTLHKWMLNEGQFGISVNFAVGTYRID